MITTEMVYQTPEEKILKNHFNNFFILLTENQLIPAAVFESVDSIKRCLSGITYPFHNGVLGCPEKENWDACIHNQLKFFEEANMPFVWYLDEASNPDFKKKLIEYGFEDAGILRGIIAHIDRQIPEIPEGCIIELVDNEESLDDFNKIVCSTFGIVGTNEDLFKIVLRNKNMCHFLARKNGKAVSALSTFTEGNIVSIWNMATLSEVRRHGISTALCQAALNDAVSKGCQIGVSYLMAEGLAYGVFSKLGYEAKWRFHAFVPAEFNVEH